MILNKLQSLSWPRLLHVALSLLCALALVLGLASGALAVGANGDGSDFSVVLPYGSSFVMVPVGSSPSSQLNSVQTSSGYYCLFILPYSLAQSGYATIDGPLFSGSQPEAEDLWILFFDSSASVVGQAGPFYNSSFTVPSGTRYISITQAIQSNYTGLVPFDLLSYNFVYGDFDYDLSSGGGADLSGITDILDAWDQGPYDVASTDTVYDFTNMSLISQNFDSVDYQTAFYTLCRSSTLMSVLSAQMWTNTSYNQDGTVAHQGFTFNRVNGASSSSQAVVSVNNLPEFLDQLGSELTAGLNKLQRDNVIIWDDIQMVRSDLSDLSDDVSDALYADTDTSPSQSWSVAEWLKGIYNSITSFFSSFWSPAETDLKEAAEEGMQEASDRDIAGSADQVGDMDDLGSGFASFGDTGNVGAGDLLDSLTGGDYSFFSSITQQNLAYQPPQQNRGFRSAPPDSDQVEYVDELSEKRYLLREVLGLP